MIVELLPFPSYTVSILPGKDTLLYLSVIFMASGLFHIVALKFMITQRNNSRS